MKPVQTAAERALTESLGEDPWSSVNRSLLYASHYDTEGARSWS